MPREKLPFSQEYRDLILDREWEYFMFEDPVKPQMTQAEIDEMHLGFNLRTTEIRKQYKKNKKQCRLLLEGYVRLQWAGGFLPAYLKVDGYTKGLSTPDYKYLGEEWAFFAFWQKLERKRKFWKMSWDRITKIGAILAIVLSIMKLIETLGLGK